MDLEVSPPASPNTFSKKRGKKTISKNQKETGKNLALKIKHGPIL